MPASCGMFGTVCCCITEDCDASRFVPSGRAFLSGASPCQPQHLVAVTSVGTNSSGVSVTSSTNFRRAGERGCY
ncbi:hypothetical protein ANDA3_0702 [plant metagenome]|uniref:Uncharacterized protein n=2 Tax=root TaxID=1 RepID=A0A1C3JXJ3_9BURK|nr:hypothetical protein ODI_02594 [Orrella dioscoreae]SOE47196.1 hypothetical protein ODI_R0698 [Orrella dioscoreae]